MLNIVIPYGSAFLLGTSLATLFIKKILPISIIIGIITLALIYLINYLFLSKFLHFSSNLQHKILVSADLVILIPDIAVDLFDDNIIGKGRIHLYGRGLANLFTTDGFAQR